MNSPLQENDNSNPPIFSLSSHYGSATFIQNILDSGSPTMSKESQKTLHEDLLKGKTLQVYWCLLTHGKTGVREIQRLLDFSSPGIVSYQLNKLIEAGIVAKDEVGEKYYITEEVRTGILGFYIRFGYRIIPRFTIYLCLCILGLSLFFLLALVMGDDFIQHPGSILFFISMVLGILVFVLESKRIRDLKMH